MVVLKTINYCKDVLCRYWRIRANLEKGRNILLALSKGWLFLKFKRDEMVLTKSCTVL